MVKSGFFFYWLVFYNLADKFNLTYTKWKKLGEIFQISYLNRTNLLPVGSGSNSAGSFSLFMRIFNSWDASSLIFDLFQQIVFSLFITYKSINIYTRLLFFLFYFYFIATNSFFCEKKKSIFFLISTHI